MLHIDVQPQEQNQAPPPVPPTQAPVRLHHLKGFTKKELKELKATYKVSLQELEKRVDVNKKVSWFFHGHYFIANYGSCLIYLYFPIYTSSAGIDATAQEVKPGARVPSAVDYGIGGSLSVIDVVYYMFLFSVRKEAIKSTLWYASLPTWEEVKEMADQAIEFTKKHPWQAFGIALKESARFTAHQAVLMPVNLSGAVTELIYLPINFKTPQAKVATGATLVYGVEYLRKYTNQDYYDGWDFWLNLMRTWLFWDLLQGRCATAWRVWLQGASSIGLRVFPLFYYIAVAAQQTLGIWLPPAYVAAATFVHTLCVRYPATFEHYMKSREKALGLLDANPEVRQMAEGCLRMLGMPVNEKNLKQMREKVSWMVHDVYKSNMLKQGGLASLSKLAVVQVLFNCFLGGYFGYGLAGRLTTLMPGWLALALGIPAGALTFGTLLYRSEVERISWDRQVKILPQPPPAEQKPAEATVGDEKAREEKAGEDPADDEVDLNDLPEMEPSAARSKVAIVAAVTLNASGSLVWAMSTVGTLQDLIGASSPETTTIITLLSIEQALNAFTFNHEKLCDTVSDIHRSLPSWRSLRDRFFSCCNCGGCPACRRQRPQQQQPPAQAQEQKDAAPATSNWCFWRRSRPTPPRQPEQKQGALRSAHSGPTPII